MFGVNSMERLLKLEENFLRDTGRDPLTRSTEHVINILNLAQEVDNKFPQHFNYKKLELDDVETEDIASYFQVTSDWIGGSPPVPPNVAEKARKDGELVIVHCAAGVSRSTTIVLAYLLSHHHMDLKEAYRFVKKKRAVVSPNVYVFLLLLFTRKWFSGATPSIRTEAARISIFNLCTRSSRCCQ